MVCLRMIESAVKMYAELVVTGHLPFHWVSNFLRLLVPVTAYIFCGIYHFSSSNYE